MKDSLGSSQRLQPGSFTLRSLWTVFRDVMAFRCEIYTEHIITHFWTKPAGTKCNHKFKKK